MSPRAGVSTRDNALIHCGQRQFLTLDIKQFYPSTTREHVYRWARDKLGMAGDVANLFSDVSTIDDRVSFGSPLTPALVALVHAEVFEKIGDLAKRRGLKISVWVDDIVISGDFIRGQLLTAVRAEIARIGLKSHKVRYLEGARAVQVTGIGVDGSDLRPPNSLELRIRDGYRGLRLASDEAEIDVLSLRLLRDLGVARFICGRRTARGISITGDMNRLRQKMAARAARLMSAPQARSSADVDHSEAPWW